MKSGIIVEAREQIKNLAKEARDNHKNSADNGQESIYHGEFMGLRKALDVLGKAEQKSRPTMWCPRCQILTNEYDKSGFHDCRTKVISVGHEQSDLCYEDEGLTARRIESIQKEYDHNKCLYDEYGAYLVTRSTVLAMVQSIVDAKRNSIGTNHLNVINQILLAMENVMEEKRDG